VEAIEEEANKISAIFNAAKVDAQNAFEAANIYKVVTEILKNTNNLTAVSKQKGDEARSFIRGQTQKSRLAKQRSEQLHALSQQLEDQDLVNLQSSSEGVKRRLVQLAKKVDQNNAEIQNIRVTPVAKNTVSRK
jgi:hypothetical protein